MLTHPVAVFATERSDRTAAATVARGRERVDGIAVDRDHRQVNTLLPGVARLIVVELPARFVGVAERVTRRRDEAFQQEPHLVLNRGIVFPADPTVRQPGHERNQLCVGACLTVAADEPVAFGELQELTEQHLIIHTVGVVLVRVLTRYERYVFVVFVTHYSLLLLRAYFAHAGIENAAGSRIRFISSLTPRFHAPAHPADRRECRTSRILARRRQQQPPPSSAL